jgi:hypothetical protein
VLYLASAAQGLAAPLSTAAPSTGADRPDVVEPIAIPLGGMSSGASGRAGMVNPKSLPETVSARALVTEDIPDSDDDYGSLSEYSRELFTVLSIIGREESSGTRSRDGNSRQYRSGNGQSTPENRPRTDPGRDFPRQFLSRFIARGDAGGEIDLLAQYSAAQNSLNLTAGEMTSFGYYAGPASGRSRQSIPLAAGGSGSSRSFLHRLFCMLGILSPDAVGLDQDCGYLPD